MWTVGLNQAKKKWYLMLGPRAEFSERHVVASYLFKINSTGAQEG
jgi:hypothetical protein